MEPLSAFFTLLMKSNIFFGRNIASGLALCVMFLITFDRVSDYYNSMYSSVYVSLIWKTAASIFCPVFFYQTMDLSSIPAVIHFGGMEEFWMVCGYVTKPLSAASWVLTTAMVMVYFRQFFTRKYIARSLGFGVGWALVIASIFGATWMGFFVYNPHKLLLYYIFSYGPTWTMIALLYSLSFRVDKSC